MANARTRVFLVALVALVAAQTTWFGLRALLRSPSAPASADLAAVAEEPATPPVERAPRGDERRALVESTVPAPAPLAAARIVGVVRDTLGAPIAGVRIQVDDRRGTRAETTSATDGAFAFAERAPGAWLLDARAEGFAAHRRAIDVNADRAEQVLEICLVRQHLVKIRFVDESGTALARALGVRNVHELGFGAIATAEAPPARLPTIGGPCHRRFGLAELRPPLPHESDAGGTSLLELNAPPPLYLSATWRNFVVSTTRIDTLPESVDLLVPSDTRSRLASTMRLRLLDGTSGALLTEAKVSCDAFGPQRQDAERELDGFVVHGVAPGLNRLRIAAEGLGSLTRILAIEPSSTLDLGTLVLEPTLTLRVEVKDERGEPVDAELHAHDLGPEGELSRWLFHAGTAGFSRGNNRELAGLRLSRYLVSAYSRETGAGARATVDLRHRSGEPLALVLRPTANLILAPRFAPDDGPLLRIVDADSIPIYECYAQVNGDLILQVAPGEYRVEIWDDESLARTIPVRVEGRATTVVASR